ncbi:MAG: CocE/NonD family hydrolase [Actinomycetota bacterium]
MRRFRLGILLAALVASAGVVPAAPERPNPEGLSKPIYEGSVTETARVPMRDGETLFVEVRRPVVPSGVKVPVILTLSPYNDLSSPLPPDVLGLTDGESLAEFYVPRGYARAIADVRGTRESSGCWDYGGEKERHDGHDLVEWLGTQAWSNGKVAMIGGSYEGTTANAAAVERPPHLATIVPIAAIDRWYDYAYINGVRWFLNSENTTDEGFDTPLGFDFGFAVPPPVDARAAEWSDVALDRYRLCDQIEHTQRGYSPQPDYDAFWLDRDYRTRAHAITIPVLVGHGLDDYNVKASGGLEMYRRVRGPKRMVIGQWPHGNPANEDNEWRNLVWRWFDRWLLGLETDVTRDRSVDVEDSRGGWHQEAAWPPPTTRDRMLWLDAAGALNAAPSAPADVSFTDDPTMDEDRMMSEGDDASRLLYLTTPLTEETRIAGEPAVRLRMISDKTSTHIAVLLASVAPDGSWERISRGFMNPRYRGGLEKGVDLVPGEAFTTSFALAPADHVVPAGHRIALAVSSSNLVWALPDLQRANNTVVHGGDEGSRLKLPVVGAASVAGAKTGGPAPTPPPVVRPRAEEHGLPATGVGGAGWTGAGALALATALGALLVRERRFRRRVL